MKSINFLVPLVFFGAEVVLAYGMLSEMGAGLIASLLMVLCLYPGVDLCRELAQVLFGRLKMPSDFSGALLLLLLFVVLPLLPTLCLWLIGNLTGAPAVGLFLCWRTAAGVALVHGFLRYMGVPGSIRSMRAFLRGESIAFGKA